MKKNKIDIVITKHYKNSEGFTREELFEFYRRYDPDLKSSTFSWRLYDLKQKNIIYEIKKGVYKLRDKKLYIPHIEEEMKELYFKVTKEFHYVQFVIWSTKWVNEFSRHQTFQNFTIIEAPGDSAESLFYKMKEYEIPNVYLKPGKDQIYNYVIGEENPIVILNLILKAPTQNVNGIGIPAIEKILVDLYCDAKTFYMYQGHELTEIYRNALDKYVVNFTKLFHYARRRGREGELKDYMIANFNDKLKKVLDD